MRRTAKAAKQDALEAIAIVCGRDVRTRDKLWREVETALRLARKEGRERERKRIARSVVERDAVKRRIGPDTS